MYGKVCVLNIIEVVRYKFVIVVYSKVCIVVVVVVVVGGGGVGVIWCCVVLYVCSCKIEYGLFQVSSWFGWYGMVRYGWYGMVWCGMFDGIV